MFFFQNLTAELLYFWITWRLLFSEIGWFYFSENCRFSFFWNLPKQNYCLQRASIFACLTGMRRSDIINLTWGNIKSYSDGGKYVEFYAQKTKARNIIPISEEAYKLISQNRKSINGKVFEGFEIIMAQKPLKAWLRTAGIKKRITFHSLWHIKQLLYDRIT